MAINFLKNLSTRVPSQGAILRAGVGGGLTVGMPLAAFAAGQARRGEVLATAASESVGLLAYPGLAAGTTYGLGMVMNVGTLFLPPPFNVLARAGVALGGLFLAAEMNRSLTGTVFTGFRELTKLDKNIRSLETGFGFKDTPEAQTCRLAAVRDMNSAFQPARAYLGQEARFFHQ